MVVANTQVDLAALKSRHPVGDLVEASGVHLRGRGAASARASSPSTRRSRA